MTLKNTLWRCLSGLNLDIYRVYHYKHKVNLYLHEIIFLAVVNGYFSLYLEGTVNFTLYGHIKVFLSVFFIYIYFIIYLCV